MPTIPAKVAARVREAARNRCGYCLCLQDFVPFPLEIDHIIPQSKGGPDEETNLWLACPTCNRHKSDKTHAVDPETDETVPLFNPRTQNWFEHFRWSGDGVYVIGLTPTGRATVITLRLSDHPYRLTARRMWINAGWHPPSD